MEPKYLGVAVSIKGNIFAHPMDGTPDVHVAAKARGDYPYWHLYAGDNVLDIVSMMEEEADLAWQYDQECPEED